jgi:hypothetical protein
MTHYEQIFGRYMSRRRHHNTVPPLAMALSMSDRVRSFEITLAKVDLMAVLG